MYNYAISLGGAALEIIDNFSGDFGYLSNFSNHDFVDNYTAVWKTNEHYFQAAKTNHPFHRWRIWAAETPGQAKRYGQRCPIVKNWEDKRLMIMFVGLKMKFQQNPDIAEKLKSLENYLLIEGNTWHDNIWGDCVCDRCKNIDGKNYLGKLLMLVRDKIL